MSFEQINTKEEPTYLHHDQQGSTRLMTGSTGTVTGSTTFDAYGNKTGSTGTSTTPLGYDGQYTSSDTGLIYLRARNYDPATAQFMSVDPLRAFTGGLSDLAALPLSQLEALGLSGGALIDWIKGHTVNSESICDEGPGFVGASEPASPVSTCSWRAGNSEPSRYLLQW